MSSRALASLILGIAISGVCLWFALKDVDLPAMVKSMGHVGIPWVIASVIPGLVGLVVRAFRWRLLLKATKSDLDTGPLISATFIGMTANNLLPARLGEVVRAWVLSRREKIAVTTVFASIMVERLLDTLAALTILGFCLAVLPELSGSAAVLLKQAGLWVLGAVAVGVSVLCLLVVFRKSIVRVYDRWSAEQGRTWLSRALELLLRFVEGLCVFKSGAQVAMTIGLSLFIWALAIASFHILADGFSLGLTPLETALVFVIVLFGVAVPSAPGFVGTFHGFCVAGLDMVAGIEPTQAAAYATLLHGTQWLAVNIAGLCFLVADRSLTWSGMMSITRRG